MPTKLYALYFLLPFALSACFPVGQIEVGIEPSPTVTDPAPTVVITQEPTVPPTDTPSGPGQVSGRICFPSEFVPAMTAYFRHTGNDELLEMAISENQTTYTFELSPSEYTLFAYPEGETSFGGSYSNAVPCGLSVDCTDHNLLPFEVLPGQTTMGADLCDWYAPEAVPPNPKAFEPGDDRLLGLVYRSLSTGRIWQVGRDGGSHLLMNLFEAVVSRDGTQALFIQEDDLWHIDLPSGIMTNLSGTPDRQELLPQWWPANPGVVVFNSAAFSEESGMSAGHATLMNLDGSGYTVVEQELSGHTPALSPDGRTLAYDTGDVAWLYDLNTQSRERFDPAAYGLNGVIYMDSPAFAPDGSRLAWWLRGDFGSGTQVALAVFDLQAGAHILIHPYQPVSLEGGNPTPVWSPGWQLAGLGRDWRPGAGRVMGLPDGRE